MATMVKSFAIQGIDGFVVDIEVKTLDGQPMISVIGLPDQAVKEAAERIHSALDESGYDFPKKKIIISLAPGDQKKRGSHFDLAMAVGLLKETELLAAKNMEQYALIGELSLNGELRACQGILPMVIHEFQWITNIELTKKNLEEMIEAGRGRWKIENEGFNNQKNGIYDIEHLNSRDSNAMKNHYLITQIADIVMQIYLSFSPLRKEIGQSIKNTSSGLLESFRRHTVTDEDVSYISKYTTVYLE